MKTQPLILPNIYVGDQRHHGEVATISMVSFWTSHQAIRLLLSMAVRSSLLKTIEMVRRNITTRPEPQHKCWGE